MRKMRYRSLPSRMLRSSSSTCSSPIPTIQGSLAFVSSSLQSSSLSLPVSSSLFSSTSSSSSSVLRTPSRNLSSSTTASRSTDTIPPITSASSSPSTSTHVTNDDFFDDPRTSILEAALHHVQREGWTAEALAAGAQDMGYPSVSAGMFAKGPVELVWYVMTKANEHMSTVLENSDLAAMTANDRVVAGIQARLRYLAPYMNGPVNITHNTTTSVPPHTVPSAPNTWAQALALAMNPLYLGETLQLLAMMSDEIWYWAGDRSVNLNWYTRRILLLGVHAATETFMLTDISEGYSDTWMFLDRRLMDVAEFGKQMDERLAMAQAMGGGVAAIATAAIDIARPFIPMDEIQKAVKTLSNAASVATETAAANNGTVLTAVRNVSNVVTNVAGNVAGVITSKVGSGTSVPGTGSSNSSSSSFSSSSSSSIPPPPNSNNPFPTPNPLDLVRNIATTTTANTVQQATNVAQQAITSAASVAAAAGLKVPDASLVFEALSNITRRTAGTGALGGKEQTKGR